MNANTKQYKLVLVGDGGVGKTKWCRQLMALTNSNQDFFGIGDRYVPTLGVEVHPINYRDVIFNIWDTAGVEKNGGLKDGYYIQGKCAVIMFSLDNPNSFKKAMRYYTWLRRTIEDKPIVFVSDKLDDEEFSQEIPLGCDYIQLSTTNDPKELLKPLELLYSKLV